MPHLQNSHIGGYGPNIGISRGCNSFHTSHFLRFQVNTNFRGTLTIQPSTGVKGTEDPVFHPLPVPESSLCLRPPALPDQGPGLKSGYNCPSESPGHPSDFMSLCPPQLPELNALFFKRLLNTPRPSSSVFLTSAQPSRPTQAPPSWELPSSELLQPLPFPPHSFLKYYLTLVSGNVMLVPS